MRLRTVIVAAAALLAAPASASGAAAPRLAEAGSPKFPDRTWVLTLPERRELTAADLQIRENDRGVRDLRVVAGGASGRRAFGVVLAIDASLSMRGDAIEDAMAAARAFAERRTPEQPLGLVLFNREASVALPLTSDSATIDAALARTPELAKGTRIYDAGAAAIEMLRKAGASAGSVVVLSDGADAGSITSADQLAALARRTRTRVYTVGLRSASFESGILQRIADDTGGAYSAAGSGSQLKRIYGALGEQLASQYLVTYRSLADLGGPVGVEARVAGFDQPALNSYTAPAFPSVTAAARRPESDGWSSTTAALIAAGIVALLTAVAVLLALRGPRRSVSERIGDYTQARDEQAGDPFAGIADGSVVAAAAERLLRRMRWWPRFTERVEISGLSMGAAQLTVITLLTTGTLVWLAIVTQRPIAAAILLFVPVAVHVSLASRVARRQRQFNDQLAETLEVVASAMRAGHSFESGLAVAAEDAEEPMRGELRRIVADDRLGVPLVSSMEAVAQRMDCRELEHVALVVTMQREAGGNTAELLDRTVETLRHRADLRRLVQGLTAQGRAGGLVVSALPVAVALMLSAISPGYLKPMVEHTAGVIALTAAAAMVAAGWLVIRKLVDIRV